MFRSKMTLIGYLNSKFCWKLFFVIAVSVSSTNSMVPTSKKTWTYEIKSVETTSSNTDAVDLHLQVDRVSRGVYAISGTFTLNTDIMDGDNNEVEASVYRSENGVDDYKILPFKISRQHFNKAMDSFYKDMIMDTLKECSDLPVFEDKLERPIEKKEYTLKGCQFSQDGFPNHLATGFYKIVLSAHGASEWGFTLIAEVTPNS
ncbi:uncharacterized protein LOC142229324 [Haematobia irritans]|uniref:uncharacterized protein LOC142229324 n=1 Tax=Haematobia irritans TaxID=7368 RepID=UPI003F502F7C